MGGRGGSGGVSWKSELANMARSGNMPKVIAAQREQQAKIFKEIDKLYKMPETSAKVTDQGDGVYVNFGGSVRRASYPSGTSASQQEKRGVLKWILYNKR